MGPLKNKKGSAMILVICLAGLISVLCLCMFLKVSVMNSTAQQELDKAQSQTLAASLSQQVEQELTADKTFTTQEQENEAGAKDTGLWFYCKKHLGADWPYFNADEGAGHNKNAAYRYYQLDTAGLLPEDMAKDGSLTLALYWTTDKESVKTQGVSGASLFAQVTCTVKGQTCTVTSEFGLECKDIPQVDADGKDAGTYTQWLWTLNGRQ